MRPRPLAMDCVSGRGVGAFRGQRAAGQGEVGSLRGGREISGDKAAAEVWSWWGQSPCGGDSHPVVGPGGGITGGGKVVGGGLEGWPSPVCPGHTRPLTQGIWEGTDMACCRSHERIQAAGARPAWHFCPLSVTSKTGGVVRERHGGWAALGPPGSPGRGALRPGRARQAGAASLTCRWRLR